MKHIYDASQLDTISHSFLDRISGVMISMLTSSAVDGEF